MLALSESFFVFGLESYRDGRSLKGSFQYITTWVLYLWLFSSFPIGNNIVVTKPIIEIWACGDDAKKNEVNKGKEHEQSDDHTSFKQTPMLAKLISKRK